MVRWRIKYDVSYAAESIPSKEVKSFRNDQYSFLFREERVSRAIDVGVGAVFGYKSTRTGAAVCLFEPILNSEKVEVGRDEEKRVSALYRRAEHPREYLVFHVQRSLTVFVRRES